MVVPSDNRNHAHLWQKNKAWKNTALNETTLQTYVNNILNLWANFEDLKGSPYQAKLEFVSETCSLSEKWKGLVKGGFIQKHNVFCLTKTRCF